MLSPVIRRFLYANVKPFRFLISVQIIIATLWALDLSFKPYLLKVMVNKINTLTPETIFSGLGLLVGLYVARSFGIMFAHRVYDYIWLKFNSPLKRQLGDALMARALQHSHHFFSEQFAGALTDKVKEVMSRVPDMIRLAIDHFYAQFIALIIAMFTLYNVHPQFAVMLILWVVVFFSGTLVLLRRGRHLSRTAAEARSRVIGRIVDIFGNVMSVRLFSAILFERMGLKRFLSRYVEADQKRDWYFLWLFAFQGITFVVYQATCLVWLMYGFEKSVVTAGDFVMILMINTSIVHNLWQISGDISKFVDYLGNIDQGLRVMLAPVDIQDKPDARELRVPHGRIVFDKVKFHYKGTSPLFENKTVTIERGQKVGLVGYSGGGKSTFVNLILRMYDVTGGRILIDDQDIRNVTQDSLHNAIGTIPQDPSLFHRTIMENIRYGKIDATDAEVVEAARRAHAHEFIAKLPEGYDALVGERGVKLSGGQRQRISIARAILKNAPILILDEATSQLDSITEAKIQESLWSLMEGKTTLVVAHRLSTILYMDRILVFERGKIVEDGTHDELLARDGVYKLLWDAQVGGFIPDKDDELE